MLPTHGPSQTQKISVVIPTYNYGRFIAEAIESALVQTRKPDDVIVVDDGSTDETEAAVRRLEADRVRYIRQPNAGVCVARNRGVAESSGDLIAFLDADDTWEPTKLEKQLAMFEADPEIGLVHCGMREFDGESGETRVLRLDGQDGWVAHEILLWERPAIIGPGGTIMVNREAFASVGGFDERMKVGEDWDFCYRVARRYKVGFVREPLVNYRSHAAAAHRNVYEMERGMGLFYQKAFSDPDPAVQALRPRALSNYHRVLAGSYFTVGSYGKFVSHSIRSIWHRPAAVFYFLGFPVRRLSGGR